MKISTEFPGWTLKSYTTYGSKILSSGLTKMKWSAPLALRNLVYQGISYQQSYDPPNVVKSLKKLLNSKVGVFEEKVGH